MNIKRLGMASLLMLTAWLGLGTGSSLAVAGALPGPLVEVEWLARHADEVQILDVRDDTGSFTRADSKHPGAGHVPGAAMVPWSKLRAKRTEDGQELLKMLPDRAAFEALMRRSGVDDGEPVVIAHPGVKPGHVTHAARLYWTLKYYGHDAVALLNGGVAQWKLAGNEVSHTTAAVERGDFEAGPGRAALVATTAEVRAAVERGDRQLVDSRDLGYYLGLRQKPYVGKAGHIPGAKLLGHALVVESFPARVRSAEQIEQVAAAMGVDPSKPLTTYCNSGNLSSGVWFVLSEVLGASDVTMYDGSMHAWTKDEGHEVVALQME